jgi:hypothetical protein
MKSWGAMVRDKFRCIRGHAAELLENPILPEPCGIGVAGLFACGTCHIDARAQGQSGFFTGELDASAGGPQEIAQGPRGIGRAQVTEFHEIQPLTAPVGPRIERGTGNQGRCNPMMHLLQLHKPAPNV